MKDFISVLAMAIQDLATYGFFDQQRIAEWIRKLAAAADTALPSDQALEKRLTDSLRTIYLRATGPGALKHHPGVTRFTLSLIEPALRPELDRRILASAELIKINRKQAIEKTLQRFSGWATSIPAGGSKVIDRAEVKESIKKSLSQVNYEIRRLNIDQGHKLVSNINQSIASQTGAIAMKWRSHWRQAGYDYREDHRERDGKVYAIRGSWAVQQGLINKGEGYSDEITAPGEEVFCRCFAVYYTSPRELPDDMVTEKGRDWLKSKR